MSKKILDLPEAVRLVLAVIEKKGADFKHQTDPARANATNTNDGGRCVNIFTRYGIAYAPGCLVGSAIHEAGYPLAWFSQQYVTEGGYASLLHEVTYDGTIYDEYTNAAASYFSDVQNFQDEDRAWGGAHAFGLSNSIRYAPVEYFSPAEVEWLGFRTDENVILSNN